MTYLHLVGYVFTDRAVMVIEVEQEVASCADLQGTECDGLRLLNIFDRHSLAFCDDVLAKGQVLMVESRLHLIHYYIYRAFADQGDEQPCEEARQPASLPRLWDVAMAAMLPLPNLCGYEEAIKEEDDFLLQLFKPSLPRYLVEGEDINVDALVHLDVAEG